MDKSENNFTICFTVTSGTNARTSETFVPLVTQLKYALQQCLMGMVVYTATSALMIRMQMSIYDV